MTTPGAAEGHETPVLAFRHDAVLYRGMGEFLDATEPFVVDGLAAGEPVMVAAPPDRLHALGQRLGSVADRVTFLDLTEAGRNPARIIPLWQQFIDANAGRGPLRGIGEPVWAGRTADEIAECGIHEALINIAFGESGPFWLICPYDRAALDPGVIDDAHRHHPETVEGGRRAVSIAYPGPSAFHRPFERPLAPPAELDHEIEFDAAALKDLRELVIDHAIRSGLDRGRAADLALAANEVASNSIQHGGGTGTARLWTDTDDVVCEVADHGGITAPLAGRVAPPPRSITGRGLWLVNQLCDLVQIHTHDGGGVVRMRMAL